MRSEIHENQKAQRRIWAAERIGWAALFLLVASAIVGIFGDGLLSYARSETGNGITVRYERTMRRSAPSEIEVEVSRSRAGEEIALLVSEDLARILDPARSVPPPTRTLALGDGGVALLFAKDPGASKVSLLLRLEPEHSGKLTSKIAVEGSGPLVFEQTVLP